jgi:predicted metal-dependent TIM-barrel fold hydrolase
MDKMKQMVEMGAFIEHIALTYLKKDATIEQFVKAIKELGADHTIIASDLGQGYNPVPTEGLTDFIHALVKNGVSKQEIDIMTKKNPARLLGLEAF